jgi:hypothetical protein
MARSLADELKLYVEAVQEYCVERAEDDAWTIGLNTLIPGLRPSPLVLQEIAAAVTAEIFLPAQLCANNILRVRQPSRESSSSLSSSGEILPAPVPSDELPPLLHAPELKVWRVEISLYSKRREARRVVVHPTLLVFPFPGLTVNDIRPQYLIAHHALFVSLPRRLWLSNAILDPADWADKPRDDEVPTEVAFFDVPDVLAAAVTPLEGGPFEQWKILCHLANGEVRPASTVLTVPYVAAASEFVVSHFGRGVTKYTVRLPEYSLVWSDLPLPEGLTQATRVTHWEFVRLTPARVPHHCAHVNEEGTRCLTPIPDGETHCDTHTCHVCGERMWSVGRKRCDECAYAIDGIGRRAGLPFAQHVVDVVTRRPIGDREWYRFVDFNPDILKPPLSDGREPPALTREGVARVIAFYEADPTLLRLIFPRKRLRTEEVDTDAPPAKKAAL